MGAAADTATDTAADTASEVRVGVLAMQGAFAEHVRMLGGLPGVDAFEVRTSAQLATCDGIVIPGGESTAIRKALDRAGLLEPLHVRVAGGLPAFGTCAGMIVLAATEPDGAPPCFGVLDVTVERNGFGRQVHSRERDVRLDDASTMRGVFIRAPRIVGLGADVEVVGTLAEDEREVVVVQQGGVLAASFHPELTRDARLHERFVGLVRSALAGQRSGAGRTRG